MGNIVYFSHGGGPLPILGDPTHQAMIDFMKALPGQIPRPDGVIVVSAHWEQPRATILSGKNPPLFYDYYGFPKEAYSLTYPVPGSPALAGRLESLLREGDFPVALDGERGFDHGLFIPLKMMYPQADIPMIQLSLVKGLDPEVHIRMGRLIGSLAKENLLIVGSGFSFHNMGAFDWSGENRKDDRNDAFQDWLAEVCTGELTEEQREQRLLRWAEAPGARYCHPREEHLLPLHVCAGAASGPGKIVFDDYILGKRALAVLW